LINYIKEIYKRKDLLINLVLSGLKAQHRNTYLGYLWWLLDPLIMGFLYYWVRTFLFRLHVDYVGAFLIIGLVSWKWITSVLNKSARSISGKSGVITQVYLPKAIFPISSVLSQMANFLFSIPVIIIFLLVYRLVPDINIIWFPVIVAVQIIFLTAVALIMAYICMFIRDIENLIIYVTRIGFWFSPVIWETDRIPERYQYLIKYNPAATLINSYRDVLMYNTPPDWQNLFVIGLLSLAVCLYMLYFYSRNEQKLIRAI